jgi:hypothetical protein
MRREWTIQILDGSANNQAQDWLSGPARHDAFGICDAEADALLGVTRVMCLQFDDESLEPRSAAGWALDLDEVLHHDLDVL